MRGALKSLAEGLRERVATTRKWRTYPVQVGTGCLVETVSMPDLEAEATDILGKLRLRGMVVMNFKRDARTGQFVADTVHYGHLRAERIIGRLPLGLRGDMRLGVALEAGKVADPYTIQQHTGWLPSVAVYLGGETPVGPAYIGLGRGRSGATNDYLFIGTP